MTLKPGATLQVEDVSYAVKHVLHRPVPAQATPRETLLLAQCLSGRNASQQALIRCLEGPDDSPVLRRARDGGELARRMNHPHLARVWQVHAGEKALYLVSEYVAGFDLETVASFCAMLKRPPLTAFVCFVGAAIADALEYLHRFTDEAGRPLGIIHRGINLTNIRLGTGGEVMLSGFDVMFSRQAGRQQTTTNTLRGDLAYAAPEYVCTGHQNPRGDFFALGMVMLELLTGSHPLDDPHEVVPQRSAGGGRDERLRAEQRPWLPLDVLAQRLMSFSPEQVELAALDQPEAVVTILKHALERDPEQRYPSGAELRDDLRAYLARLPVSYSPEVAVEEVRHLREQARATARRASPLEWDEPKG
jgi:serine/threonine-protein kinase